MCGIAGLTGERDPDALSSMLELLAHRGPDDDGQEWFEANSRGWVGLGTRRLAIIDRTPAGHQPMRDERGCLAYNGEVYNFPELRKDLEGRGEVFVSGTDTEVVLKLLCREGADGLARLNGMFALAYWDTRSHELLLARDRFGIKPLYFATLEGRVVFASEAKPLFRAGVPRELEPKALGAYLSFGWVPGERTLFRDVSELPPGHVLRWREEGIELHPYRDVVPRPDPRFDRDWAAIELGDRLEDAVRRQLIADVPVGVMLSGGLDSSAIAALATRVSSEPVRAYTIAFREEDARLEQNPHDARYAREVARTLGIELREFVVHPKIVELVETVVQHVADPVADPAAILTYLICREAAGEVTVLLSGQGSDELFGGYLVHVYPGLSNGASRVPLPLRKVGGRALDLLPLVAERAGGRAGVLMGAHRAGHMILDQAGMPAERRYVTSRATAYFHGPALAELLTEDVRREALAEDPFAFHLRAMAAHPELDFFDRMLYADFKTFLPNQNLHYSDRMSMAASIELRVPYLDDAVADLALILPKHLKVRGLRGKEVLRRAMRGLVPDAVIRRRKAGFGAPIRTWLRGELRPFLEDTLSERWLRDVGLFEPDVVHDLLEAHASGREDHTYRIWTLLTFAVWHRTWLEPSR